MEERLSILDVKLILLTSSLSHRRMKGDGRKTKTVSSTDSNRPRTADRDRRIEHLSPLLSIRQSYIMFFIAEPFQTAFPVRS